jgi:hypothetical protein
MGTHRFIVLAAGVSLLALAGCPADDGGGDDTSAMTGTSAPTTGGSMSGGSSSPSDPSDPSNPSDSSNPSDPSNPTATSGSTDPGDGTTDGPTTGGPGDVPAGWTCDPEVYGTDDGCDCGCGVVDPDCPDMTAAACEYCDGCLSSSEDCSALVQANDNSACIPGTCGNAVVETDEFCDGAAPMDVTCEDVGFMGGTLGCGGSCNVDFSACTGGPEGWTCIPDFYGADDGCDCGCGVVDPDCADATAASCEHCGDPGACEAPGADCSGLDPADNAACL